MACGCCGAQLTDGGLIPPQEQSSLRKVDGVLAERVETQPDCFDGALHQRGAAVGGRHPKPDEQLRH
jgi:hypothetical protein